MKKLFCIVALLLLGAGGFSVASAVPRPEVARYIKAYSGQEGITVWTLRIGAVDKSEALVQITGIDHPWDMRIRKLKVEPSQHGNNYVATVDGKRFVVLAMEGESGQLYLPGSGEAQSKLIYSKTVSEQGNPEHLLTEYLKQDN
ncbi:MAG: hypothetical protein ABIO49_16535 [Dokdonella sp.]